MMYEIEGIDKLLRSKMLYPILLDPCGVWLVEENKKHEARISNSDSNWNLDSNFISK